MWIKPKTDWNGDDFFNIEDFNRIKNNILELHKLAVKVYPDFSIKDMGSDKSYSDYLYADEVNVIEENIEDINRKTINLDYGQKSIFVDNGPTMTYADLNRWEFALSDMHEKISNALTGRRKFKWKFEKGGF